MDPRRPEQDADDELARLVRLDWAWSSARRHRRAAFTVAALLGVVPWLHTLHLRFIPETILDGGTILWAVTLILSLALTFEERGLKRDLDRFAERLGTRERNPVKWRPMD
jgi:hypothetical protein